ncbi:hypothetical protein SAMN02787118_12726 [Streptomyces mirabilis]|uniref:Uncharacterized protein n=1 Tax=Streptomyces mirabilis TaxID=68239 RepID=A0A1I2UEP3_9ACTN|nr:hypothetical protein SAMN02787118_12726 [Streptomyces mirabilis]
MSLRDFLERFRPVGTPGASATGVAADRTAERAAELEPALAQLTDGQQGAARGVREGAAKRARHWRAHAGPAKCRQLPCWISTCLASAFSAPRRTLTVSMPSV